MESEHDKIKEEFYDNKMIVENDNELKFDDTTDIDTTVHKGKNKFNCDLCEKFYTSTSALKYHIEVFHGRLEKFNCGQCKKSFVTPEILAIHEAYHNSTQKSKGYKCDICEKIYYQSSTLKTHFDSVHGGLKVYQCNSCEKSYSRSGELKKHFNSVHEGCTYICNFCGTSFTQKYTMKKHVQIFHNEEKNAENFDSNSETEKLVKIKPNDTSPKRQSSVHEDNEDHKCEYCGMSFSVIEDLMFHTNSVHDISKI